MTPRLADRTSSGDSNERGIALITALLVLMLISALLVGFTTVIVSDQRYRVIDRDRGQAFYAAAGAIEKQTVDLGNLFLNNVSPTNAQVTALVATASKPVISNVTYTAASAPLALVASELSTYDCNNSDGTSRTPVTVGTNGYTITFCGLTATNNPTTLPAYNVVQTGTYAGLMALKTPYQMDVTAVTNTGGEAHLVRTMEAVSIPVFQFGIFSIVDLAFNAADNFSFGGRVHTNGNLFLSEGSAGTLTLSDKVDAYGQVVRQVLSNGVTIATNSDTGPVNMTKGSGTYRALAATEGSVVLGPTSASNDPTWTTISLSTYKGYITDKETGAKQLNLPLVSAGGQDIQLVQRPAAGESTTSFIYGERLFNKASIRVLLSDTAADITAIPGIDNSVAPSSLEAGGGPYGGIPVALSPGPLASTPVLTASTSAGTGKALTVGAGLPAFMLPPVINVSALAGAETWTLTACTVKTTTALTCTLTTLTGGVNTVPIGATVSAAGVTAQVTSVASTPAGQGAGRTVTFAAATPPKTMGFSMNTFWIDDEIITCSGFTTTTLTGCTLASNVSNGDKIQDFATMNAGTSVLGGFIKIERQNAADSTWHDITPEILGYGIGGPSQVGSCTATDPSPNAILRLERYADDAWTAPCIQTLTTVTGTDYWPNTLFDFREAYQRDAAPASGKIKLGGVMNYVAIDAANLAKWFSGTAPYTVASGATGTLSKIDNTGYSIHISDRRSNTNTLSQETAEWGWEDFVNPLSATATPNGALDTGEDVNGNGTLEVYGGVPSCNGTYNSIAAGGVTCASTFFTTAFTPDSDLATGAETFNGVGRAMVNRPIMFRRAVKLIHGSSIGQWVTGFTVVTENPVYVQGDWNCSTTVPYAACTAFADPHAATSVDADAVTLLSNNWNDVESFTTPYDSTTRPRDPTSYYRMAVLAGKGPIFPQPTGTGATFGTDGGAHSFLRFLEGLAPNTDTVNYEGSMATFYYSRQAVGIFKGTSGNVYGIPANRNYSFDTDFQTPSKLPPLTPMFRDLDVVGFSQQLQPGK